MYNLDPMTPKEYVIKLTLQLLGLLIMGLSVGSLTYHHLTGDWFGWILIN